MLEPYAHASLGPAVAYELVKGANLADAQPAQRLCEQIIETLLVGWSGPKPSVHVRITSDADYGAHANFTGDIFVDIGTFNKDPTKGAQSEDELALMLGHELSHFLLLHQTRKQITQDLTEGVSTAASLYMTYSLVKNSHMDGRTLEVAADQRMYTQAVVGGLATTMLVGDMFAPSWDRSDESDADRMGLDLARRAGYHVGEEEIKHFIRKQSDEQASRSERMQKLQAVGTLMILAAKTGVSNSQDANWFNLLKLCGAVALDKFFGSLSNETKEHPDGLQRISDLTAYSDAIYGSQNKDASGKLVQAHTKDLNSVLTRPDIRGIVTSADTAEHVLELVVAYTNAQASASATLQSGATAQVTAAVSVPALPAVCTAGRFIRVAAPPSDAAGATTINAAFPNDSAPFTWRVRGDWQEISPACRARAAQDYNRSINSNYATIDLLRKVAAAYSGTANALQLPAIYDRYKGLIGTDQDFPDLAVAAAMARNDLAMAETKTAECYTYDNNSLYPVCTKFLGYDPLSKGVEAKTPEGKKAFSEKGLSGSLHDLFGGAGSSIFGK